MLAWSNLKQGLLTQQVATALFHSATFSDFYKSCFYCTAGVILFFLIANLWLTRAGPPHLRKMSDVNRVVFISHCAFCLIFLGTCVPYSIALVRLLFTREGIRYLGQRSTYRCVAYPLSLQLVLYAVERSFRAMCRVNAFLIVHHLMFCSLLCLAFEAQSSFVIKVDLIVSCFATFEFLLYASLIARRVNASVRVIKCIMATGLAFYGFTRLVQAALLIGLFVAGYGLEVSTSKGLGLWWTSLVMSVLLSALQCYTFVIYSAIWRRLGPAISTETATSSEDSASGPMCPMPQDMLDTNELPHPSKLTVMPELLTSTAELLPR